MSKSPSLAEFLPTLAAERQAGYTLPRAFYVDDEVYHADLKAVFRNHWLFAGVSARVPRPGDYFVADVGPESVIIIRGEDHVIRAFANVCRHRGSQVCTEESGSSRALVCPYHQWVYGTDGALLKARLMPDEFDTRSFGLKPVPVGVAAGLVFICLGTPDTSFDGFASTMSPRLSHHRLESAAVAHIARYDIRANWKLVVENSRECYHCGAGHPQYTRAVGFAAAIGSDNLHEADRSAESRGLERLESRGIITGEVPFADGGWYHFRRFFLRPGMVSESLDGRPVAPLMAAGPGWDAGVFAVVTFPDMLLEASPDYVMTLRLTPAGPSLTRAEMTWLVAEGAQAGRDYEVERLTEFWRLTAEQDWALCEGNHAGVASSAYEPGPYAPSEAGVEGFVQWYLEQLRRFYDRDSGALRG